MSWALDLGERVVDAAQAYDQPVGVESSVLERPAYAIIEDGRT